MEDRIQHDEAAPEEYLIQDAYEVALKVGVSFSSTFPHYSLTPNHRSCLPTTSLSCSQSLSELSSSVSASQHSARQYILP